MGRAVNGKQGALKAAMKWKTGLFSLFLKRPLPREEPVFSGHLFWDCKDLDYEKNKDLIMERVFRFGREEDEIKLFRYYRHGEIRRTVKKLYELDEATLSYLSVILDIPKEKFRCYKTIQSRKTCGLPW
jgi:hypothetical protein